MFEGRGGNVRKESNNVIFVAVTVAAVVLWSLRWTATPAVWVRLGPPQAVWFLFCHYRLARQWQTSGRYCCLVETSLLNRSEPTLNYKFHVYLRCS